MRVDWSRAPRWAMFAAQDSNGAWYWYEREPFLDKNLGMFCAGSMSMQALIDDQWEKSLEARPGTTPRKKPESYTEVFAETSSLPMKVYPLKDDPTWKDVGLEPAQSALALCEDLVGWTMRGWTPETLVKCQYARYVK